MDGMAIERNVVTGATGFVGANVVRRLLQNHPDARLSLRLRAERASAFFGVPPPRYIDPVLFFRLIRPLLVVFLRGRKRRVAVSNPLDGFLRVPPGLGVPHPDKGDDPVGVVERHADAGVQEAARPR
jgi:hypothetical protein